MGRYLVVICIFLLRERDELYFTNLLATQDSSCVNCLFSCWVVHLFLLICRTSFIFWKRIHFWFYVLQISSPNCGLSLSFPLDIVFFTPTKYFKDFLFAYRPLIHSEDNFLYGGKEKSNFIWLLHCFYYMSLILRCTFHPHILLSPKLWCVLLSVKYRSIFSSLYSM